MIFNLQSIEQIYLLYKLLLSIQVYWGKQIKPLLRQLQYSWGRLACFEKDK